LFSGDTECVPEIKALRNIEVAFLTMNLALHDAAAVRPKVVYPYHYRGSDLKGVRKRPEGRKGVEVRARDW